MYAGSHQFASAQYQDVAVSSGVHAADAHGLIRMLLAAAIDRIAAAKIASRNGDAAMAGQRIGQAVAMVTELRSCLDHQQGGDIAADLDRLYDYLQRRLTEANRRQDGNILQESMDLLAQIHEAWVAIRQ